MGMLNSWDLQHWWTRRFFARFTEMGDNVINLWQLVIKDAGESPVEMRRRRQEDQVKLHKTKRDEYL